MKAATGKRSAVREERVRLERDGAVATVTLNRPGKLNAFDGAMCEELVAALVAVAGDAAVRAVVVTGAGRAFCAGADIGYLRELLARRDWEAARALVEAGREIATAIRTMPKPVLAAVNGVAAGGGANLALACDLRIASERASIGQTFSRIGLCPDWGGTYFLPRLVGPSKALELFLTGDVIDAAEAVRLGVFSRAVAAERLEAEARGVAEELAARPPLAVALAKRATYASEGHSLAEMLDVELANQLQCFQSQDAEEGLGAFLEKRSPVFVGK